MGVVHDAMIRARRDARPCFRLERTLSRSASHLGGLPELPAGAAWPTWNDTPLSFLAQIELNGAPASAWPDWAPREGRLLFFYDALQQPWGFDPKDRGCCSVMYVPPGAACAERLPPEAVPADGRFRRKDMTLTPGTSYPSYERLVGFGSGISEEDFDAITEELDALQPLPDSGAGKLHQMFGYPAPVQGDDMEWEAHLASNGTYCGGPESNPPPTAKVLEDATADWQLLFQLDSDDDTDMMWGDSGMLYFWIRRDDAERRDFSNVWLVLQCC